MNLSDLIVFVIKLIHIFKALRLVPGVYYALFGGWW